MIAALHLMASAVSLIVGASALFVIAAMLHGNWPLILSALKGQGSFRAGTYQYHSNKGHM